MERLSVSLDGKSVRLLDAYGEKHGVSKAEVVRKALATLDLVERSTEKVPLETVKIYLDFLADREHLILDVEHWEFIWRKLADAPDSFWDEVRESGRDHREQYASKGLVDVKEVLEFVERTNWYTLKEDSADSFTLVLAVTESSRFVRTFFEGFFEGYPRKVTITNGSRKVRICVK